MQIGFQDRFLLGALVLVLLAQAQDFLEDFHIEALSLGLCEDFLLALIQELRGKVGDGVNQAADLISATASIPSLNFTPSMTFDNWF